MASYPRYLIINNDSIFHVTWQCHNQSWFLEEEWAKQVYYNLLLKYKDRYLIQFFLTVLCLLTLILRDIVMIKNFFLTFLELLTQYLLRPSTKN